MSVAVNVESYEDPIEYYEELTRSNLRYIMTRKEAVEFLSEELVGLDYVALDFETTSLSPITGEVRLSCIKHPHIGTVILDHFSCGKFSELVTHFLENDITWVVYNAKFEWTWFQAVKPDTVQLLDVDFLAKAKLGGHPTSLARMCKRDLGVDLSKALQNSDWSRPTLTDHQILYAGLDATLTWALFEYWETELTDEQWEAAWIFQDAVPGTVECEQTGMYLDVDYHLKVVETWRMKQEIALRTVRRFTPKSVIDNLNSKKQVSDFIKSQLDDASLASWPRTEKTKTDQLSLERKVIAPIAAKAPYPFSRWLNAFILYNFYAKYTSTYGQTLITKQTLEGFLSSRYNIAQAATGRYSSSNMNMQNIPRKPYVRKAFYCPPDMNIKMVLADYSGIELRVLAEISGDERLKEDVIYGNVHASSAATINKIDEHEFLEVLDSKDHPLKAKYKELRSSGKPFSFQLTYGASPPALSIVLKCSVEEATEAVTLWSQRYPKAYNYRHHIFDIMNRTGFIELVDGRTIYVRKPDRTIPVASNYGVQGAAASVMYRAMHHVYWLIRKAGLQHIVKMSATVHDELILYCFDPDYAEAAEQLLIEGMKLGWLDIFPGTATDNLIESAIGDNWAAKP